MASLINWAKPFILLFRLRPFARNNKKIFLFSSRNKQIKLFAYLSLARIYQSLSLRGACTRLIEMYIFPINSIRFLNSNFRLMYQSVRVRPAHSSAFPFQSKGTATFICAIKIDKGHVCGIRRLYSGDEAADSNSHRPQNICRQHKLKIRARTRAEATHPTYAMQNNPSPTRMNALTLFRCGFASVSVLTIHTRVQLVRLC